MILIVSLKPWLMFFIFWQVSAVSYNQPKFCPNPTWNTYATTFATVGQGGSKLFDVFIDTNNTVYATNQPKDKLFIWSKGNPKSIKTTKDNLRKPRSVFVTASGDIYVDSHDPKGQVDKWTFNSTKGVTTIYTNKKCWDLFVDINNTLYCSMHDLHQVVTKSLNSNSDTSTTIAGKKSGGSDSYKLKEPRGIFVDINFDLYVADCKNDRIQLFQTGNRSGTTVAATGGIWKLKQPSGIVLDAEKHLFIVDTGNNRIMQAGLGPDILRCLVGCSERGSSPTQLNKPFSLSFDSYGNMFVIESGSNKVLKFNLMVKLCDEKKTTEKLQTSTMKNENILSNTIDSKVTSQMTTKSHDSTKLASDKNEYTTQRSTLQSSMTKTESASNPSTSTLILSTIKTILYQQTEKPTASQRTQTTTIMNRIESSTNSFSTFVPSTEVTTALLEKETTNQLISSVQVTGSLLIITSTQTTILTTMKQESSTEQPPSFFIVKSCNDTRYIGLSCNVPNNICKMNNPCLNNGNCTNNNTSNGYTCLCASGFNGTHCEFDQRLCKPHTCLYRGKCNETSNATFNCTCNDGWQGTNCESIIDLCKSNPCMNKGVCRPTVLNYTCQCLGENFYSGRHCEIRSMKIMTYTIISKSFGYIAILAIIIVVMFVLIMDILKYCFGIDPVYVERKRIRRARKRKRPVIQRFIYVDVPTITIEEIAT